MGLGLNYGLGLQLHAYLYMGATKNLASLVICASEFLLLDNVLSTTISYVSLYDCNHMGVNLSGSMLFICHELYSWVAYVVRVTMVVGSPKNEIGMNERN